MTNTSRIKRSILTASSGVLTQILSIVLNFAVRTVFIMSLNTDYLGVSGLFTNILTMLSLVDLGFGTVMVYKLYAPLAEDNHRLTVALMRYYKRIYVSIGIIVGCIGACIVPFLGFIITTPPDVDNLLLIYCMFLANSVMSYFFAYKRAMINADQKGYIINNFRTAFIAVRSVGQIAILLITQNYILFLGLQIFLTVLENLTISLKVDRLYPFIKSDKTSKLTKEEIKNINNEVKAIVVTRVGNVIFNGTDNIIISTFVGVKAVGFLSNYTLIIGALVGIISQLSNGVTSSVGNFIAKESKNNHLKLFKLIDFMVFWIYGLSSIILVAVMNPFIEFWLGNSFLLSDSIVLIISFNLLIDGIRSTLWMFRSSMGLFVEGQYRHIASSIINLAISIFLVSRIGILGVLIGTAVSRLAISFFYDAYIIFKVGFKENVIVFYRSYIKRVLIIGLSTITLLWLEGAFNSLSIPFLGLVIRGIVSFAVFNIFMFVFYINTYELDQVIIYVKKAFILFFGNRSVRTE